MDSEGLFQTYLNRLEEARLYLNQGLGDGAVELFQELLDELHRSDLSQDDQVRLRTLIEAELATTGRLESPSLEHTGAQATEDASDVEASMDAAQTFQYGMALMDGQFWEEAVEAFKTVALTGHRVMESWELCGDCSARMEQWEEAIRYYEIIYRDPEISEKLKRSILIKITKCSKTQRRDEVSSALRGRPSPVEGGDESGTALPTKLHGPEVVVSSISDLDQGSIGQLLGSQLHSWTNPKGESLAGQRCTYRILNLLQVGVTSQIVELERERTGERFAGQSLTAPFGRSLSVEALAQWVRAQQMTDSRYLVKVFDLAYADQYVFIVREYLPLSLVNLLSHKEPMPVSVATCIAYQMLEALGDLHLHMGRDEQIRNIYHLDLRPSRILLRGDKPRIKVSNGGLWKVIESCNPKEVSVQKLPLPFLAYRAPEQFRTYLARRKPPVFTDLYLFGTLFYEMLTGVAAFRGASYGEYEIQHCEQYPTPPKVWRPEIPDELNHIVMKCLESDPFKRWRSATELSLILEKAFYSLINLNNHDDFSAYMKRTGLA